MKKNFRRLYFTLIGIGLIISLSAQKKALIIAVGDYPDEGLWPDISSVNDIRHIEGALLNLGYKSEDILKIQNESATKKGILNAFQDLTNQVKKNDFVYIHYSGHGQQIIDDNNDELDNLDEAIVPYDSPLEYKAGVYEGENLIRDEELGQLTTMVRNKIGADGQLVLILDSCHSGSGTRGSGRSRGTDKIMGPSKGAISGNGKDANMGIEEKLDENAAPMSSFFGASARELNYETIDEQGKPVGTLSFALSSVLAQLKNNPSHSELYQRIKHKMKVLAPNQNPQWEGPSDLFLFSSDSAQSEQLFTVQEFKETEVKVAIGTLNEIYEGTVVELISGEDGKVICQGEVILSNLTNCYIELDESLISEKNDFLQVRIIEKTSPPFKCTLINNLQENSEWNQHSDEIENLNLIQKGSINADLYISNDEEKMELKTADGRILYSEKYNETRAKRKIYKLHQAIGKYAQGKYLKSFDNPDSPLNLKLEVLNVDCKNGNKEYGSVKDGQVKVGECIKLKVTNIGNQAAYFSVIDIQPDNIVNLVIPATGLGYTSSEYYLNPGESYETNYTINIGEPFGHEVLKLISSDQALDLPGILQSQGASRGANNEAHAFEKFFANSFSSNNSRGTSVERPSAEVIGTYSVFFEIIDK